MITIYEERRKGAVADTIEHSHTSLEQCLEVIQRMDGFTCSQVTIAYRENMIMIGGGSEAFIVTVETSTALHNLLGALEEEDEDEFVEITVGGQACEFPQKYIVSFELVESALIQLLEGASVELNWEMIDK
ncbi:hypothetical protein [Paenibacillus sp. NPDC058071]|uniref:hypothetical protein n=1 Tax=Paenibacillus sp. NPDC058071 TaxID=3346326 RepID=UPI0036DB09F8